MIHLLSLFFAFFLFAGCVYQDNIDIGDIVIDKRDETNISLDRYISFSQEFFENRAYSVNRYCEDKKAFLTYDKFSTEIYIKVMNRRTKLSAVGKYPIWFLLNDDSSNIRCVKRSSNFVTKKPLVVNGNDKLILEVLQKNRDEKSVPVRELGVLLDVASFIMPYGNFLLKGSNIVKDNTTKEYLNSVESAFKRGGVSGVRTKEFDTHTKSIRVELIVSNGKEVKSLGYILLKPIYTKSLSTVDIVEGVPNFRYIYSIKDPRVADIMDFKLSSDKRLYQEILAFKTLKNLNTIEALNRLNTYLLNNFTSYDRALILTLALRETPLYKEFKRAIESRDINLISKDLAVLNLKDNPLHLLSNILNITGIEYYTLMHRAEAILREHKKSEELKRIQEQKRRAEQEQKRRAILNIENFFIPVSRSSYIDSMFIENPKILDTRGNEYNISTIKSLYNRDTLLYFGCFVNLKALIYGISIQDYLIHSNYTSGIRYDYMALAKRKDKRVDTIFYKIKKSRDGLKIERVLIDMDYFISKDKLKSLFRENGNRKCLDILD
jgi:hypothetical protein